MKKSFFSGFPNPSLKPKSPRKTGQTGKRRGMSLVEILIAILLTGVLAMLTLPKFVVSANKVTAASVGRAEQVMQQLAITVQLYQNNSGATYPIDLGVQSYDQMYEQYGTYLAYNQVAAGPPAIQYYLLADGSRLSFTPELFTKGAGPPASKAEYTPAPAAAWWGVNGILCANLDNAAVGSPNECAYLDVNGKDPPNAIGKTGDIIPIRIDPATGRVRTVYQWIVTDGSLSVAQKCAYVSAYDVLANVQGAAACP